MIVLGGRRLLLGALWLWWTTAAELLCITMYYYVSMYYYVLLKWRGAVVDSRWRGCSRSNELQVVWGKRLVRWKT